MNKVIILGNDHTNSLGLVQTLGKSGFQVYAFVWGAKTDFVSSSKYATKVLGAPSIQGCIDLMLHEFAESDNIIPIIACCDSAALALEKNKEKLADKFIFEHSTEYPLEFLFKKENQKVL